MNQPELENRITSELDAIGETSALKNEFFSKWISTDLLLEEVISFRNNYFAWVEQFPNALSVLIANTKKIDVKCEYVKTLYSELGNGDCRRAHSVLLMHFFSKLISRMRPGKAVEPPSPGTPVLLPTTQTLIQGELALYADPVKAKGAQLALEWQAYTMLRKLYDGARRYENLWEDPDEFHEDCEYFYVHIGSAEKDHKVESLTALKRSGLSGSSLVLVKSGYHDHLNLIGAFWNGLARSFPGCGVTPAG